MDIIKLIQNELCLKKLGFKSYYLNSAPFIYTAQMLVEACVSPKGLYEHKRTCLYYNIKLN